MLMNTTDTLPWKRWSEEKPTTPGNYWLAFYDSNWIQKKPSEPYILEICKEFLTGEWDIYNDRFWDEANILWFGPLTPPPISGKKK